MTKPFLVGTSQNASDTTVTIGEAVINVAVTIDAAAKALVVFVGAQNSVARQVTGVTINFAGGPIALTKIVDAQYTPTGNKNYSSVWFLSADHPNWQTGAFTISATPNAYSSTMNIGHAQLDSAADSIEAGDSAGANWGGSASTAAQVAVDSAADELILGCGTWYNVDPSAQSGSSIFYQDNNVSLQSIAAQSQDGVGAADVFGYTMASATEWAICAASFRGVTAGGGPSLLLLKRNMAGGMIDLTGGFNN